MKSWISKVGVTVVLALTTQAGSANALGGGVVVRVGGVFGSPSSVYFAILPVPTGRAACNSNASYQFVFDPSTSEGKALYSALLTAKATGTNILVYGTGTCILGQAMEGVSYWILDP